MVQKCEVQPLSAIANVPGGSGVGGPMGEKAELHEPESLSRLGEMDCESTLEQIGSPPRQVGTGKRRARPAEMVLLPPLM